LHKVPAIVKTNKELGGMPRKRAPGAGRKPKGEFTRKTATFTTRITHETRMALEHGARETGRSISQHAESILRAAIHKPTDAQRRNQALARTIALVAENLEKSTGQPWNEDAFTGQALRHATEALLFHFAPTPPDSLTVPPAIEAMASRMPPDFGERYRTPAGIGHLAAYRVISEVDSTLESRPPNEWSTPVGFNVPVDLVRPLSQDLRPSERSKI
jgi:hypothetical protein